MMLLEEYFSSKAAIRVEDGLLPVFTGKGLGEVAAE